MTNELIDSAVLALQERERWEARVARLGDEPELRKRAVEQRRYYDGLLTDLKKMLAPKMTFFEFVVRWWHATSDTHPPSCICHRRGL